MVFIPLPGRSLQRPGSFYEGRAPGLGARFLDATERAIQLLQGHPDLGTPLSATIRSVTVPQFPYAVVYRVDADRLFVVAVAHFRRRPKYWAGRIR